MRKTPQQFRRESVKELFDKVLGESKTELSPLSINISESLDDDFTTVDLMFSEKSNHSVKIIDSKEIKAKGFVDGLFLGLHEQYAEKYKSLDKIKLVDIMVNPIMKAATVRG